MDARDHGNKNPFDNTLYCLEWIASAMEAARRHKEQRSHERAERGKSGPRRRGPKRVDGLRGD